MSTYQDELRIINKLEQRMAKFVRVALHCHTPGSYDWARSANADKQLNDKTKFLQDGGEEAFLANIKDRNNCQIISITDHMKCSYAERLANYATKVGSVAILPGMEVNFVTLPALAGVRLHVLVILPEDSTKETFAKFLLDLPLEEKRTGTEEIKNKNLSKWIEEVHSQGGICIAAHVESENGIRQ